MATAVRRSWQSVAMAADRVSVVVLLAAALLFFAGAVRGSELRPRLLGAPQTIDDPENDEGLERALQFAMTAYNRASNDMYSSRVVRIISAQKQIVAGVKYIMEVEIARTTCTKPATDIQRCAFLEEPQMARHTICKFVVLNVPWRNQVELLESKCHQAYPDSNRHQQPVVQI